MQRNRILLGIATSLLLAGCAKTYTVAPPAPDKLPTESKAEAAQNAADVHTRLAQHYIAIGNIQGALEKLKLALKFDPNYVPAHTVIGYVYERINDMPHAEAHYRRAEELQPKSGDTNNNLGAFLCRDGQSQAALPYFAKALADPFYATPDVALTNQGICQMQLHDRIGAQASFREALQRNPKNADALLQQANVMYLNNDAFRAKAFLQRFEALGQPSPDALKLGYEIESRLGNMDAARNYSKRLSSQFPDSEQAQALKQTARP